MTTINDLPEDVIRHEIMGYLKPVYTVVEIEYVKVESELTPEEDETMMTCTQTEKRLFKVMPDEYYEEEVASYPGGPKFKHRPFDETRSAISNKLLGEFESNEIRYINDHNGYVNSTIIYLSHIVVC
jgi:YHS domain-containing protein